MWNALGDAATWIGENAVAPIVTGTLAGLAVWWAQRRTATPGDVASHNRVAGELQEDLARTIRDLDGEIEREVRAIRAQFALEGLVQMAESDVHEVVKARARTELAAKRDEARDALGDRMRRALWQYRDQASRVRRVFAELAQAEESRHERYRKRRKLGRPDIILSRELRQIVAAWRERPDPYNEDRQPISVRDDPTDVSREPELAAFETEDGLTWEAARRDTIKDDT